MIWLKIFYDLKAWKCVEQDNCDGGVNFGKMNMSENKYDQKFISAEVEAMQIKDLKEKKSIWIDFHPNQAFAPSHCDAWTEVWLYYGDHHLQFELRTIKLVIYFHGTFFYDQVHGVVRANYWLTNPWSSYFFMGNCQIHDKKLTITISLSPFHDTF